MKSTQSSTATMESWEKYNRVVSSIGAFTLTQVVYSMIVPVIAKWDWATVVNDNDFVTNAPGSVIATQTQRYYNASECHLPPCVDDDVVTAHIAINPTLLLVFLSTPIVSIILAPAVGYFADTFGFDLSLLIGLVIAAIISVLFASSSTFLVVLPARTLTGLFGIFIFGNSFGRVFQVVTPDTHDGNTVVGCILASYMFQFFGPAFCGLLFNYFGQVAAFLSLLPLEIILGMSIISTYQYPSTLMQNNKGRSKRINLGTKSEKQPYHDNTKTFLNVICDHRIMIMSLILTISWLPKCSLEPIMSIWVQQRFAGDAGTTSLVWGMAGFAVLAASMISIYVLKYCTDNLILYTAFHFASCTLPMGLLPFMPSPASAAVMFTLTIYFAAAAKYGALSIITSIAEREYESAVGRVMSMVNIGLTVPYLIGPLISIPLYNTLGFHHMCLILTPISLIFSPLLLFIKHKKNTQDLMTILHEEHEPECIKEQDFPPVEVTAMLVQPANENEPPVF